LAAAETGGAKNTSYSRAIWTTSAGFDTLCRRLYKSTSLPAGAAQNKAVAGAPELLKKAWGIPRGILTKSPGRATFYLPLSSRSLRPSSTKIYSSCELCMCGGTNVSMGKVACHAKLSSVVCLGT
jgi:hypothetical protein